jgi:hypothetical protein
MQIVRKIGLVPYVAECNSCGQQFGVTIRKEPTARDAIETLAKRFAARNCNAKR